MKKLVSAHTKKQLLLSNANVQQTANFNQQNIQLRDRLVRNQNKDNQKMKSDQCCKYSSYTQAFNIVYQEQFESIKMQPTDILSSDYFSFMSTYIGTQQIRSLIKIMKALTTILIVSSILVHAYDWTNVEDKINFYQFNGAFGGGVLRVANGTHNIYTREMGKFTHNNLPYSAIPFTNQTIFDLASLTKVTATLSCIMHLVDQGKIAVDDLVSKYIPEYANHGKQPTLLRNLLLHNAGLEPDYPGVLPNTKQEVMLWTYNCSLMYPIGTKMVYSDLSFILLGQISERVIGKSLNVYTAELMHEMGMPNTTYLPDLEQLLHRIAPTQYSVFRKTLIRGHVHDPTSYLFGGVAGHAGLFSVAEDLETYMQIHLNKGVHRNGTRIYKEETVTQFYQRQDGLPYNNRRALGWDTVPIQKNPPCGNLFSLNSFGHTGYTGTLMWADRDKGLIVVFLTHRVHPTDESFLILEAWKNIMDQIVLTMSAEK